MVKLQQSLADRRQRLERAAMRLELLDPQLVLQRGYTLLTDRQGHVVTSVHQAPPGAALQATLADGALDLLVQQMVAQVQSFPLIAIPFFMLTGTSLQRSVLVPTMAG